MNSTSVEPPEATTDSGAIHLIDTPSHRVHRFADFLNLAGTLVGIAVVLLLGAYASGTTSGLTADLQGIYEILRQVLVAPVNVLEGIVTLVVPAATVASLAVRREPRRIVESLGALVLGIVVALIAAQTTRMWGARELVDSLSITTDGLTAVTMPAYLAGIAAMLTTAGRRRAQRPVAISWNVLWVAAAIGVISGLVTVPAVVATLLIGRAVGLFARYVLGSASDRAYGAALVEGITRAGFTTKRLIRIDPNDEFAYEEVDPVFAALSRTRAGRVYALTTVENHQLMVIALDGDRRIAGTLSKIWRTMRLRGLRTRADVSLRHVAEGTALVSHAARTAGVRTPRVMGMSQARDTMILIYQRPVGVRAFADLAPEDVTDDVLDGIWAEVVIAHAAGISHRALTSDTVLVGTDELTDLPEVWLTTWEMGEVATGQLSRRMDAVQLIAMFSAKIGADRAVASAFRALESSQIAALAPLLQTVVLPRATRIETKARGKVLENVRNEILEHLPETPTEPENIARFSPRTIITFTLGIVAAGVILFTFKIDQVVPALKEAEPLWAVAGFGFALLTFIGAALVMSAFSPIKLPWNRVLLAQVAAAYVALAAPAGVGPAAINLRLLTKRDVARPVAVATVALVQVSAIFVTVVGLVVLTLATGSADALAVLPSGSVLAGVGITAVVVALALTFPKVRAWVMAKIMPTIRQTWPRLVQVLGQPWRLALGIFGNLLLTGAYVGAFYCALRAFNLEPAVVDIAVVFLLGNAAGAAVPTPGGVGAVEAALSGALLSIGIPVAIGFSAVVVFRAVTYWARIPLGYVAMRYLTKKGEL